MPGFENLERLADQVRRILPDRKALARLETVAHSRHVLLQWHDHQLIVKLSGQAFEMRGNDAFATGVSILLTTALMAKEKTDGVLVAVMDSLRQAEQLVANDTEKALALLGSVKAPIQRLRGKKAGK